MCVYYYNEGTKYSRTIYLVFEQCCQAEKGPDYDGKFSQETQGSDYEECYRG